MTKRVAYIVSNINKALAFEWIVEFINKDKYQLFFILINPGNSELEDFLKLKGIKVLRIKFTGKKDILRSMYECYKFLKKEKIEIVHCHLFEACIIGLASARLAGVKKRIYTRHHSTLHHVYFPKAVYYDKFINYLATHIVAISNVVKTVLLNDEKVNVSKIRLINHGFVLSDFEKADSTKVEILKSKYNKNGKAPVIGVISRYIDWKGIEYIISAFKKLLDKYPSAYLILANAHGPDEVSIKNLLKELPEDNFIEVRFENDIFSMYHLFNVFVHTPIDSHSEAFGQIYVEALAAGIPSVFAISGVASEFIIHRKNAMVVDHKNSEQIYESIVALLNDAKLCEVLKYEGLKIVKERFEVNKMIKSLEEVYIE